MSGHRSAARWAVALLVAGTLCWVPAGGAAADVDRAPAAWKALDGGEAHTCGVRTDGTMWCWGHNGFGQLGDGTEDDRLRPRQVGAGNNWKAVAVGTYHSCGLKTAGTLWCWGMNASGQLGDGTGGVLNAQQTEPVKVDGSRAWTDVDAGEYHTCAVAGDGSGWCWGSNTNGQVGDTTAGTNRLVPARVRTTGDWRSVAAGGAHSCGVKTNGSAWCWGYNGSGEVGDGTSDNSRLRPVRVGTATTWTSVTAGEIHSCGTRSNNTAWCWGDNRDGQIGSGGLTSEYVTPTKVLGTGWTVVEAGVLHTCGTKQNKSLWCWGSNGSGQLGDGGTSPRATPAVVSGAATWRAIGGGGSHTCAVRALGTAWCWGWNSAGQLGDGTRTERHLPVKVRG